ncbi:MAG: PEP-CTERM sorting domain-containing protein [Candidatus Omnitrophota bacterium]
MKKILLTTLITLFIMGFASTAKAVTLDPGGVVTSLGVLTPSGSLVTSLLGQSFIGKDIDGVSFFSGTLDQYVYKNKTGLLFVYQVHSDNIYPDHIQTLSTTGFSGFAAGVDIDILAGKTISRSSSGGTITFNFLDIADNTTSPYYWIQTDARYLRWGGTNLIDGGTANLKTYAPGPGVPEPTTMLLFGMGVLGLIGLGRKKA